MATFTATLDRFGNMLVDAELTEEVQKSIATAFAEFLANNTLLSEHLRLYMKVPSCFDAAGLVPATSNKKGSLMLQCKSPFGQPSSIMGAVVLLHDVETDRVLFSIEDCSYFKCRVAKLPGGEVPSGKNVDRLAHAIKRAETEMGIPSGTILAAVTEESAIKIIGGYYETGAREYGDVDLADNHVCFYVPVLASKITKAMTHATSGDSSIVKHVWANDDEAKELLVNNPEASPARYFSYFQSIRDRKQSFISHTTVGNLTYFCGGC